MGLQRIGGNLATEKAMAPHSSTLAWKIPWTEEPGRLQSMGSLRVGHDWATSLSLFTFMHWRRKWQPTPVFLPGESQGRGAWWATVYGVAQSRTRLKWLNLATEQQQQNNFIHTYQFIITKEKKINLITFQGIMIDTRKQNCFPEINQSIEIYILME